MYVPNNVCIHSCRTTRLLFFSKEQKIVRQKSRTQAMHFSVVCIYTMMSSCLATLLAHLKALLLFLRHLTRQLNLFFKEN